MRNLPLFLDVRARCCALVGAGEIAARKLAWLRRAGATVRVIAPEIGSAVANEIDVRHVTLIQEAFRPEHLDDCVLVISATNDRAVNVAVAKAANARNLPVNVVDDPELCTFIVPAVIDRDPITVAVSSAGTSPVLARWIRSRIESLIPSGIDKLARFFGARRQAVTEALPEVEQRRRFWESLLDTPLSGAVVQAIVNGRAIEAGHRFDRALEQAATQTTNQATADASNPNVALTSGAVYLIGAGPGDPELLTFRALKRLQQADVVVYDRLVSPEIVDLARRDAERLYVGKCRGHHSVPQAEISQKLVELARAGKIVARLKGGDPFVFGRGGEEIQALAEAGLPFEVVPGITAATGCAAYAGIPLTHRDHAQSVHFVTGHTKPKQTGNGELDLDWANLAGSRDTLVFYMGLGAVDEICHKLAEHGMPRDRAAALVEHGTTPRQQVYTGTITTLTDRIAGAQSPALLIIGEVVNLHEQLAWFQGSPEAEPSFLPGPPLGGPAARTVRSAA